MYPATDGFKILPLNDKEIDSVNKELKKLSYSDLHALRSHANDEIKAADYIPFAKVELKVSTKKWYSKFISLVDAELKVRVNNLILNSMPW